MTISNLRNCKAHAKKSWDDASRILLRDNHKNMTVDELAELTGRTGTSVISEMGKRGFPYFTDHDTRRASSLTK